MPIDSNSLFKVNIQINANDIITLNELCSEKTNILDLKEILLKERNLNDLSSIVLKYNDITMENDKILKDYNIIDSRHIIKLIFSVKPSTHVGLIKKYSFIKDDRGASDHLQNNDNTTVNSNYNTLPSYAQPRQLNCCEKLGLCCHDFFTELATACRDNPFQCSFITLFILFLIGYLGASIGNSVALVNQYQIYNEYIETPTNTTTEMLNYYCKNNANEFSRNISRDLLNGSAINITFTVMPFLSMVVIITLILLAEECGCTWIDDDCCGYIYFCIFGLGTIGFYVASVVYNSIILWTDMNNIRNYCDSQTDFYQKMIGKWSVWNYINTIIAYFLLPCICCLIIIMR